MRRFPTICEALSPDDILKMFSSRPPEGSAPSAPYRPVVAPGRPVAPTTTAASSAPSTPSTPPAAPTPSPQSVAAPPPADDGKQSGGEQEGGEGRMVVDEDWMEKWYNIFNDRYWGGKLPHDMRFSTNNNPRQWGCASYSYSRQGDYIYDGPRNFSISMSNFNESPEWVKKNTLLHEMIHIADYVLHPEHFIRNGRKVSRREYDAHGPVFFQKEAQRLAADGWTIQKFVSAEERGASSMSSAMREKLASRISKAVAMVLVYRDGHKFIIKTDNSGVRTLVDYITVRYGKWYSDQGLVRIELYRAHSDKFNIMRSQRTRVMGWECRTEAEFLRRAAAWEFDPKPYDVLTVLHS